jgi:subtilase family serine protease
LAAILAIADQRAGNRLGHIDRALYHIGQARHLHSASFFDVTSGTNSAVEFDVNNNAVTVQGFEAGPGWDATTGLGSPMTGQLVDELIEHVSSGDGTASVGEAKPHANGKPSEQGRMSPH